MDHQPAPPPVRPPLLARVRAHLGLLPEAPAPATEPQPRSATSLALEAVACFLDDNALPLGATTLAIAFDCVTGADPHLAGAIVNRRHARAPITLEWLAEQRGGLRPEDEVTALTQLMERMETNIHAFARTTVEAQSATSQYRSALRSQVDELAEVHRAGAVIAELVTIARAMMERTREIETQIARSEQETRALHRSLVDARRIAELDHLTGLPNRRAFEHRFTREVVAARAAGDPLCVAFCDIDCFKAINDTHGHEAGDRVLKVVARTLDTISDERCHVARHGGEEFVVLFRGRTMDQAFAALDHARDALAARRMVNRATDVPFGKVTFSAGLADVLAYADPRAALRAADEALYVAKDEGRNRIVRAPARLQLAVVPTPRAA